MISKGLKTDLGQPSIAACHDGGSGAVTMTSFLIQNDSGRCPRCWRNEFSRRVDVKVLVMVFQVSDWRGYNQEA